MPPSSGVAQVMTGGRVLEDPRGGLLWGSGATSSRQPGYSAGSRHEPGAERVTASRVSPGWPEGHKQKSPAVVFTTPDAPAP